MATGLFRPRSDALHKLGHPAFAGGYPAAIGKPAPSRSCGPVFPSEPRQDGPRRHRHADSPHPARDRGLQGAARGTAGGTGAALSQPLGGTLLEGHSGRRLQGSAHRGVRRERDAPARRLQAQRLYRGDGGRRVTAEAVEQDGEHAVGIQSPAPDLRAGAARIGARCRCGPSQGTLEVACDLTRRRTVSGQKCARAGPKVWAR